MKEMMLEYVDAIIVPYMTKKRNELTLSPDASGLCVLDVIASHRCDEFLHKLGEHDIIMCLCLPVVLVNSNPLRWL